MTTLRVHFDGCVLVPEEPVNLPIDKSVEVQLQEGGVTELESRGHKIEISNGVPIITPPPRTPPLTMEDIQRFENDES